MERGFIDNSNKKKKEGGSMEVDSLLQVLGDLAKRVKNIEGKPTMPKGILKKAMCNVAADIQDVVVPLNDVNNANMDESGSMKNKEDANLVKGDTTTVIAKSCSLADSHCNKDSSTTATPNEDLPKTACSFANVVRPKDSFSKVHFRAIIHEEKIESFDCVLPNAAAAKYVLNTWRKLGFETITRNDDGMDQVLEKGPWLIRKSPIVLNKCSTSVSLKKGEVTKVHVWVKLYNVPVLTYSEDGLSLIATQIGKPIMLDAFTNSMCEVTMPIPDEEGDGHTKEVIRVVYEWKPPHCVDCQSFGHDTNLCPKHVREEIPKTLATDAKDNTMDENDDGFVEVKIRKKKKGADSQSFSGIRLNKTNSKGKGNGCLKPELNSSNPFDVLNVEGEEMGESGQKPKVSKHVGTVHLNVNKKKDQEPSSSKSAINDVQEDKTEVVINLKMKILISLMAMRIKWLIFLPRPDTVARFLMPSMDRSRRRRFRPVTSSPRAV
nr:hypothetical protein [Tanacetum cinerariifolium]